MTAKSLDVYALAKLILEKTLRSYAVVANEIGMSTSEFHAAVRRLAVAGLIDPSSRAVRKRPTRDFLFHGIRYVFPAKRGELVRGLPTSFAAPPLADLITASDSVIPVWPSAAGETLGYSIEPLHPAAPRAASRDPRFYEFLALIDAIREGAPRESRLAMEAINQRFKNI